MSASPGYRFLFGPVASRRLGRSLGVDVLPAKVCTLDCVYCEVGATTRLSTQREEFVPLGEVLDELKRRLAQGDSIDCITLSGSGEPTLYSRLGELIVGIKALTPIPVAVLTNGTLLWCKAVQDDLLAADIVVPSYDAATAEDFARVNRPHPSLSLDQLTAGLVEFRRRYQGKLWLEVLLVAGLNDSETSVRAIARVSERIRPDRVQLNTVVRPPAQAWARAVPFARLAALARLFTPPAEVVAPQDRQTAQPAGAVSSEDVLQMLRRRPCSLDDIARGLGIAPEEAKARLEELLTSQRVRPRPEGGVVYYSV